MGIGAALGNHHTIGQMHPIPPWQDMSSTASKSYSSGSGNILTVPGLAPQFGTQDKMQGFNLPQRAGGPYQTANSRTNYICQNGIISTSVAQATQADIDLAQKYKEHNQNENEDLVSNNESVLGGKSDNEVSA